MDPAESRLPTPPAEPAAALAWVREHLGDLALEEPEDIAASPAYRGGQPAADGALALHDVGGYARRRNEVLPVRRRGASGLSPYIRHGLLPLRRVWDDVAGGDARDVRKFRDELLWQEYARHLYARMGTATREPLRRRPPRPPRTWEEPWPREMACVDLVVGDLERDGWLVNQTRMWLAGQWTPRAGWAWREGEDRFFTHLLDGSRAANRLGWQWTVGAGTGRPYGFSRFQVRKRAPGLCDRCRLSDACPIADWPEHDGGGALDADPRLRRDDDLAATAGPSATVDRTDEVGDAEVVWLTAESLGDADPALAAHDDLPAVFVFDAPLLRGLRLSGKRLVFLAETLGALAEARSADGHGPLEVHRGDPVAVLADRPLAVTHAPVPGWRRRARLLRLAEEHPWPWLADPHAGPVTSFSAWRRALRAP